MNINSLKSFVKTIADKAGNELSPSHRPSGASSEEHHVPDEGFICPSCMTGFASAEELQAHYEARHGSEAGLEDLRAEVAKVRSTLNQEKLHSTELKREVDRLSGAVHNRVSHEGVSKKTLEEEHSMYREQVLALQEGKALLAQEVISLRNELSNCQISGHEKEKLLEKTAQLAAENVELKAAVDELAAQRQILQEQVNERSSVDDASVLRQELVSVQKMMDQLTLDKDRELQELRQNHEVITRDSQDELRIMTDKVASLKKQLDDKESLWNDLEITNAQVVQDLQAKDEEISSLKVQVTELEAEKSAAENQLNNAGQKSSIEVAQLQQRLTAQEAKVVDVSKELSILNKQYDEQCQANDELQSHMVELRGSLAETQRHLSNRDVALKESTGKVCVLEETVAKLRSEKSVLMQKIEAGEGASTALSQLKQRNEELASQLDLMSQENKKQISGLQLEIDDLHKHLQQEKTLLGTEKGKLSKAEQIAKERSQKLEAAQHRLAQVEEELNKKAEFLAASDELNKTLKTQLESQIRSGKAEIDAKTKEMEKMSRTSQSLRNDLDKEKQINEQLKASVSDKETTLEDQNRRLSEAEAKILKLESALSRVTSEMQNEINAKKKAVQEKEDLENSYSQLLTKHEKNEKSLEEICNNFKKLEDAESTLANKLESRESEFKQVSSTLEELKKTSNEDQKVIEVLRGKESDLLATIDDQLAMMATIKKEAGAKVDKLSKEIEALKTKLAETHDKLEKLERTHEAVKAERGDFEVKICQLQSQREQDVQKLEKNVAHLERAQQLLLEAKVDLQNQLDLCQGKCRKLEQSLEQREEDFKKRADKYRGEIERLQKKMAEDSAAQRSALEKSEESRNLQEQKIASLEQDMTKKNMEMGQLNEELNTALSERLELEAKMASSTDERKSLLERCLEAEAEVERARSNLIELRRKLDDSQAALQELGRENQAIQLDLAKESGRKWADDSDVTECRTCFVQFTLTNRKHHCRNCGQIFCKDCSSKLARMANYRKPQRVCDHCYSELHGN